MNALKIFALGILCICFIPVCHADLDVTFSKGKLKPTPIALLPFQGNFITSNEFKDVIENDLNRSGYFDVLESDSLIESELGLEDTPKFESWKITKVRLLLTGTIETENQDSLIVKFRLWDIYSQKQMLRGTIKAKKKYRRRLAHIISDLIYKRVTGVEGYFDSRIVYIAETGSQKNRTKRLALMDQDGFNHQYLSDINERVITPRFSPSEQKLAYMKYEKNSKLGKIYILDLETGKSEVIQKIPSITYAPRFSPDGKKLAFSQVENGSSSLYLMDLTTKKITRLTNESSIDTSPSFSPDGKKIVFNSDRGKRKQIYIIDLKTKETQRISFGGGVYATPIWSPDGNWIAFTKIQEGSFYIGIMKPDGTKEKLVATGYVVESPSWAPNSRTLCFYKQEPWNHNGTAGGKSRLYTIDLSGANQQEVPTPMDGTDPSWSPPLPFEQLPKITQEDLENI